MAALRSRCGHCMFVCGFFFLSFFLFPCLISAVADWMSTIYFHPCCDLSANLGCRSETCCTRLAKNAGRKKSPKIAIWAPSHNFVGLYLRKYGTYRESEKNLLSSNIFPTCLYNMVNFGLLAAQIGSLVWGTSANFNGFRVLAALLHGTVVVGVSHSLRRWTEDANYTVSQKRPTFTTCYIIFTYTVRLRQFWHKCCRESRQSKCTLFSHHT